MEDRRPDESTDPSGTPSVTVLRLGGSLLTAPDLVPNLLHLVMSHGLKRTLVVVGGGAAADIVRTRQPELCLDDTTAHWMAIATMTENARQLLDHDPQLRMVSSRSEAELVWITSRVALLDTATFLQTEERLLPTADDAPPDRNPWEVRLPAAWSVTSDSIAAWIAVRWPARALWLLKSCDAPAATATSLAISGHVDRAFPKMLPDTFSWRWVNFRQPRNSCP